MIGRLGAGPLAAVALVAALLFTAVPWATPEAAGHAVSGLGGGPATGTFLPAALRVPWADRAGFNASYPTLAAGAHPATGNLSIALTLFPRDPGFFAIRPAAGPHLTPGDLASRYLPTPSTVADLTAYFAGLGLSVRPASADRLTLLVSGPAHTIGPAFGTQVLAGSWHGRAVDFPASVPALPAPFSGEVAAVSGLSQGFTTFTLPYAPAALPTPAVAKAAQGRTSNFITPSAVHQIYDLNGLYNYSGSPHWATGVGIAIVLWGEGYAPADLQGFFGNYYPPGFPPVTVDYDGVNGAPAPSASAVNDPSGASQEMTLDLEWAGSAAPGATLHAVYAPNGPASNNYSPSDVDLETALSTAVQTPGVDVVSMSFGTPDGSDPSFQAAFTTTLADAQARGITVLAASGDTGGTVKADCTGGPSPEFPAASPYVVAVGGTAPVLALNAFGTVTGIDSEPAWNRSGGGYSTDYGATSWQEVGSAAAPIRANGHRGIPDVAGPSAYNFFYFNGAAAAGQGTSFATPMWAGMIAEMDAIRGSSLGFVTPRLYSVGAEEATGHTGIGLVDITQGSTCITTAAAGWDTATGWGSPRALTLYQDLSGSFVNVALTVGSPSVAPGGAIAATVNVRNASSHQPLAGLNVTLALASANYVGPCGGAIATTSLLTSANGTVVASLGVPGCFFGSSLVLTATVSSGGYFGTNSTTVSVNLVGLSGFLAAIQTFPYNLIAFVAIMLVATVIGWRVGAWRHRRERARLRGNRPPSPPAAAPVAAPPQPPRPPAPPASPPRSVAESPAPPLPSPSLPAPAPTPRSPIDAGGSVPAATPVVEVPAHVLQPPPPPHLPASPSDSGGVTVPGGAAGSVAEYRICASCGSPVLAAHRTCPVCGAPAG